MTARPTRLDDASITARLGALPGWRRDGDSIVRQFTFSGFPDAVAFITRLVEPAESINHHPDVDLRYNRVTIRLSTHDQGGLTDWDFRLASLVDGAIEA